jgi:Spy/CpxP family protein refolding chaperone
MIQHARMLAGMTAMITVVSMTGCGQDVLSSTGSSSGLDIAAQATATIAANSIDSELLALADDIEVIDESSALPSHRPPPRIDRLQQSLELNEDQVNAFEAIMEGARLLRDPIISQVRDGSITRDEARIELEGIRNETKAQIEALLTPDQLAKFEDLRAHHGRQFSRESLAEILNLTDNQQTEVEAVMQDLHDQIMAIREQVESDGLTREEARAQIQLIRESELEQLSAILDEDQLTEFRELLSHRRFGFGPRGFGRGPRGQFGRPGMV